MYARFHRCRRRSLLLFASPVFLVASHRAASSRVSTRCDATRRETMRRETTRRVLISRRFLFLVVFISDNHRDDARLRNPRQRAFCVTRTNEAVTTCCSDALTGTVTLSDDQRMQCLKNLTDLLSRTFKAQFVFPALGHEDIGVSYSKLATLWQQWLPPEALDTFEKGTYART